MYVVVQLCFVVHTELVEIYEVLGVLLGNKNILVDKFFCLLILLVISLASNECSLFVCSSSLESYSKLIMLIAS